MVVIFYIKLSSMQGDRHSSILMCLLLLVAEEIDNLVNRNLK